MMSRLRKLCASILTCNSFHRLTKVVTQCNSDCMDAFPYFKSGRALLALLFVSTLLFAPVSVRAETEIRSLTGIIEGHQVGGVTIDLVGNIYVADFGDLVWKITT